MTLSDDVVTLRPWSRDDAGSMADAFADPAIRRYNGALDRLGWPSPPLSVTDAGAVIDEFTASGRAFAATGAPTGVAFAITDSRSGELVGCCGVDDWSKADIAQFGYWLAPSARGRGYASRAVILFTRWLFELGAARVFLTIVAGNEKSAAVARRAGFVHEGTMRSYGVWQGARCDVMLFAALPFEWPMRASAGPGELRLTDDRHQRSGSELAVIGHGDSDRAVGLDLLHHHVATAATDFHEPLGREDPTDIRA